jgi:hypothetical protein
MPAPSWTLQLIDALADKLKDNDSSLLRNYPPPSTLSPPNYEEILDNCWSIEELGLFEPDLDVDAIHPAGNVVTIGRNTVYRNIDAFCQLILDAVTMKGSDVVHNNLYLCLRGMASRWWTFELSDIDKEAIRTDPSPRLSQWTGRLMLNSVIDLTPIRLTLNSIPSLSLLYIDESHVSYPPGAQE